MAAHTSGPRLARKGPASMGLGPQSGVLSDAQAAQGRLHWQTGCWRSCVLGREGEREKRRCVVPLISAFTGWFLSVP